MSAAIVEAEVKKQERKSWAVVETRPDVFAATTRILDLANREEPFYEVEYSHHVEIPTMGILSALLAAKLSALLKWHASELHLGWAVSQALFVLDVMKELRRRPDLAFVSAQRWPSDKASPEQGDRHVGRDLAVEVVSVADTVEKLLQKVHQYLRCGVRLVWLVFPVLRQVYA